MKKILFTIFSIFAVVLLVACKPKTYTVKFDTNGGNPETIEAQQITDGKLVTQPENVTKTGFELEYWYVLGQDLKWDFQNDKVTEDITLVAQWKDLGVEEGFVRVTFSVTLPANTPAGDDIYIAGEFNHDDMNDWDPEALSGKAVRDGLTATFTLDYEVENLPVEILYKWTRGSWASVEQDEDAKEIENRKVTITSQQTITDVVGSWEDLNNEEEPKEDVTVTFNVNGGNEAIASQTVLEGSKILKPVNPTKADHVFFIWTLDEQPFDFDTVVTKDITLVANWVEVEESSEIVTQTVTASYSGSSGNFDGNESLNQAALIGLDTNIFTVLAKKSSYTGNQAIGVNADGSIRLYSAKDTGNGNELTVKVADGNVITALEFTFGTPAANRMPSSSQLTLGTEVQNLIGADLVSTTLVRSDLNINQFNFKMNHTGADSAQVWILSIKITYGTSTSSETGLTNEQKVISAKNTLTTETLLGTNELANEITKNLNLPQQLEGVTITWSSNNTAVIANNGVVNRDDANKTVVLTATFNLGSDTLTKTFTFVVLEADEDEEPIDPVDPTPIGLPEISGTTPIADVVASTDGAEYKIVGVVTSLAPYNSFSIEDDSGAIALRIGGSNSANINFVVGDAVEAIVKRNVFNGLVQGEVQGTHVVHKGNYGRLGTINLNEVGLNANTLMEYQSRTVSMTGAEVTATNTDSYGTITLEVKLLGGEITIRWDNRVTGFDNTLMKSLKVGDVIDINEATLGWYNGVRIELGRTSELTRNTDGIFGPDATNEDKLAYVNDMLTENAILGLNADAQNVKTALNLIKKVEDVTITWTSNNTAVIDINGKVTRPNADVNVKLTATIAIGGLTTTKDFDLIVLQKVETNNPSDEDPEIVAYYSFLDSHAEGSSSWIGALESKIKVTGTQSGSTSQVQSIDRWGSSYYLIYTGQGSYGNREHTVPASYLRAVNRPEDDLHNLRASNSGVNSDRGNMGFGDGSGSYKNVGGKWYPGDEHKGDVARIVMYIVTRNNIPFDKTVGGHGPIGNLSMFLRWHEEDPVDEFERTRNDRIFDIQKSRNPFIDYPEYAELFFGSSANVSYESQSTFELLIGFINHNIIDNLVFQQQYVDLNRNNHLEI